MTIERKLLLPPALVLAALAVVATAQLAGASHPRPRSASPLKIALVPAYEQCTAPNRTHGPPLAFGSCNPPAQISDHLTVGTPDANSAAAKAVGSFTFKVKTDSAGRSALLISLNISDVRCKPGTAACGSANAADGPDYTGELESNATIRITDHFNAVTAGGGTDPGTVVDIPFPVNAICTSTADTSVGSTCTVSSTATQPGIPNQDWFNGKRVVVEITEIHVFDGGADGHVGTGDNTLFMTQGIFIP
ncbi:MAG: hypothetical protein ACRDLQ_10760 [Solirubrobacterales bacterium]